MIASRIFFLEDVTRADSKLPLLPLHHYYKGPLEDFEPEQSEPRLEPWNDWRIVLTTSSVFIASY